MAYQQTLVTSILDIPAVVAAFAAANGWTVNNSVPNQPVFSHPSEPGALSMRLRATISGVNNQNHRLIWESASGVATSSATTLSPKLAGSANNPVVPAPTSVDMFTGLNPRPYLAVVISYGVNLYRHHYFGFMNNIGGYTGGEVISGSAGSSNFSSLNLNYLDDDAFKHLFKARHSLNVLAKSEAGGVRLVHPNNPVPWRVFFSTTNTSAPFSNFLGDEIIGGQGDGYNDNYSARGHNTFAGTAILTPLNLLISRAITSDVRFRPVGNPCGVALVNMRDLQPGQEITMGLETWRVYPMISKRPETLMPSTAGQGFYRQFESSVNQGIAYKV